VSKLLDGLKDLEWPEQVKSQQENWIGRSVGALIKFPISPDGKSGSNDNFQFPIEVFTTRPDTIFGVTYLVVAPEHVLIQNLESSIKNYEEISKYIESVKDRSERTKTAMNIDASIFKAYDIRGVYPEQLDETAAFNVGRALASLLRREMPDQLIKIADVRIDLTS
jgi:leucyl-tRNA synthetase